MAVFFDILKGFFFFLTVLVGLFFLRGELVVGDVYYDMVKQILMPGYLLFCGLMAGYLVAHIRGGSVDGNSGTIDMKRIYVKSFLIGIGIGLVLAIAYMAI